MATTGNKNINAKLVAINVHFILQVLLGDVGAGKSSLVLRFVKGQFVEFQESTIGAAFFSQTLAVNDATVKFEIWDTAGQERYHSLAPMYYRGAAAAIIVYDITNQASFERAKKWVQELQAQGNPGMVMALAGNKVDLLDARKVAAEANGKRSNGFIVQFCFGFNAHACQFDFLFSLATQEAQTYAQENGLFFKETSAKTASNVNEIFYEIGPKDYLECSQHKILLEWFSWIDLQNGVLVPLVALRPDDIYQAIVLKIDYSYILKFDNGIMSHFHGYNLNVQIKCHSLYRNGCSGQDAITSAAVFVCVAGASHALGVAEASTC
ncbi:hypothetical protein CXB51_012047 [Gossypium anomalum]|uniref:Uncharacterized protein n=1 Tax=Gossypium anomalum TaxID=47600 RepID=A0A8J5ZQ90_9ROSI|nr:hypothetical protein CXB51_012047 [Gossypium anomalum]